MWISKESNCVWVKFKVLFTCFLLICLFSPFRPVMDSLVPCWQYIWIVPPICLWVYLYNESTSKRLPAYKHSTWKQLWLGDIFFHFLLLQKEQHEFTHNEKHGKQPKVARVRNCLNSFIIHSLQSFLHKLNFIHYCPWLYVGRIYFLASQNQSRHSYMGKLTNFPDRLNAIMIGLCEEQTEIKINCEQGETFFCWSKC